MQEEVTYPKAARMAFGRTKGKIFSLHNIGAIEIVIRCCKRQTIRNSLTT